MLLGAIFNVLCLIQCETFEEIVCHARSKQVLIMIRRAVLDFSGCRCQTCFIGYHLLRKSGENSMVMSLSSHRVKEHYNWETNQLDLENEGRVNPR